MIRLDLVVADREAKSGMLDEATGPTVFTTGRPGEPHSLASDRSSDTRHHPLNKTPGELGTAYQGTGTLNALELQNLYPESTSQVQPVSA